MTGSNEKVTFPLSYDTSAAYNSVNQLASYTQKKLQLSPMKGPGPFGTLNRQAASFNRTLELANNRMVAFAATSAVVYSVVNAFKALYQNAMNAEKALANIQVNVKLTNQEMNTLTSDIFKAANATGNSFYVAAEAAAEFGRQGLKASEIAKATAAALVLTQISGMDVTKSVETLTAAINSFGKESVSYESLVNKMAAADTNFAVSSKDIAEALGRVGSTAKDAGVSLEELIAAVTSVQQTTARGGAAIGNAFKTIFTRLQREDVASAIENIGIATKDSEGNFLNSIDVIRQLAQEYDNLSDAQQSKLSEKIGGVYQINIIKALINDLEKSTSTYGKALSIVEQAQNEAFIKSEFLAGVAINKVNEAKNSFVQLSDAIGKIGLNSAIGDLAQSFTDLFSSLSTSLNADVDTASFGEKLGQSTVKGIINAISGPGLATIGALFAKIAAGTVLRSGKDFGQILAPGAAKTQQRNSQIAEENKQRLISIDKERILNERILAGNAALQKRLAIMGQISATVPNVGGVPIRPYANRGKSFASGMVPAMQKEMFDIAHGVGGAPKTAKPRIERIKTKDGKETVVVNSSEIVVRDYMNSGMDAVFNKDMIRGAGGPAKVKGLANGITPNLTDLPVKKLIAILKDDDATISQKELAAQTLRSFKEKGKRKTNYFAQDTSLGLGIPRNLLEDTAIMKGAKKEAEGFTSDMGFSKEFKARGLNNMLSSARAGVPVSMLSNRVSSEIAKNPSGFSKGQVEEAQARQQARDERARSIRGQRYAEKEDRAKMAYEYKTQREEKARQLKLDRQKTWELRNQRDYNPLAFKSMAMRGGSFQDNVDLVRNQTIQNKNAKDSRTQGAFAEFLAQNPFASERDVKGARKRSLGFGGEMGEGEFERALKNTKNNRNERLVSRVGGAGIAGSIGGQILGDQLGMPGLGSAISQISTGASLGSVFGPIGAAVGATVGGMTAFTQSIKASTINLESLKENINNLSVVAEREQGALNAYLTAKENYENLIKDPNAKNSDIRGALRERAAGLAELPSDIRQRLVAAESSGDKERFQDTASEYSQKQNQKLNSSTALASISTNADKNNTGFGIVLRQAMKTSVGQGSVNLDWNELDKSLNSFLRNYDFEALKELSGQGNASASNALEQFSSGNFARFLEAQRGLGVSDDGVTKDVLGTLKQLNQTQLAGSFKIAKANLEEFNKSLEENNKQIFKTRAALEDVSAYFSSLSRKGDLESGVSSIKNSLYGSRLDLISRQPGSSDSMKNALSYIQESGSLSGRESDIKKELSTELAKALEKTYTEKGRNALNGDNPDFISNLLKDGFDSSNIEGSIDTIITALEKNDKIPAKSVEEIIKLRDTFKINIGEVQKDRQIQIEQLKALNEISKKQEFDKLIEAVRNKDTFESALENVDLSSLTDDLFAPSKKQIAADRRARETAIRTRNVDPVMNTVSRRVEQAQEALEINSKKVSRGEAGLSPSKVAELNALILKGKTSEEVLSEARSRIESSRGANQATGRATRSMLEQSAFTAAGLNGGRVGSVEALEKAATDLERFASTLPMNQDRRLVEAQASSIREKINSQSGASGVFEEIKLQIAKEMQQRPGSSGIADLGSAYNQLDKGNSKGAMTTLQKAGYGEIAENIKKALPKRDASIRDSINGNANDAAGISDFSILFQSSSKVVADSNLKLETSLNNLGTDIRNLGQKMQKEANISSLGAKRLELEGRLSDAQKEQNIAKSKIYNPPTADSLAGAKNLMWDKSSNSLFKSLEEGKDKDVSNFARLAMNVNKTGNLNPGLAQQFQKEGKGFYQPAQSDADYIQSQIDNAKKAYPSPDSSQRKNIDDWERNVFTPLKNLYLSKTDEGAELQVGELQTQINSLTKAIEEMSSQIQGERAAKPLEEKRPASETKSETSVSVNLTGIPDALASVGEELSEVVARVIREQILAFNDNPELFKAFS